MAKKFRNRIALHPLLRKGGAHVKSKSNERHKAKKQIRLALVDVKHRPGGGAQAMFVGAV